MRWGDLSSEEFSGESKELLLDMTEGGLLCTDFRLRGFSTFGAGEAGKSVAPSCAVPLALSHPAAAFPSGVEGMGPTTARRDHPFGQQALADCSRLAAEVSSSKFSCIFR